MAPLKETKNQLGGPSIIKTRSSHITTMKKEIFSKRKADESPLKRATVKRSAMADFKEKENAVLGRINTKSTLNKKSVLGTKKQPLDTLNVVKGTVPPILSKKKEFTVKGGEQKTVLPLRLTVSNLPKPKVAEKITIKKGELAVSTVVKKPEGVLTRRASKASDLEKSDSSLYVSALEDLKLEDKKSSSRKITKRVKPPAGVADYDEEQMEDLGSVALYAMDIFSYLKSRENSFIINDYIAWQPSLNRAMRALLIDWMVEIQENFELNHETLYLAVKIVDLYLSKVVIKKENLQLVGCTSLFVASKYDERIPPMIDDFLYVCDNLYVAEDITGMEVQLLRKLDFQLGIPISYRFLRRYARCAKIEMPLLTLARYILEYALMDYSTIRYSDSKMAAAALLLALIMKQSGKWTPTLEYYSGYKVEDFKEEVLALNASLHKKQKDQIKTVKTKYSHTIFFEVAKIPLVDNLEL